MVGLERDYEAPGRVCGLHIHSIKLSGLEGLGSTSETESLIVSVSKMFVILFFRVDENIWANSVEKACYLADSDENAVFI